MSINQFAISLTDFFKVEVESDVTEE